MPRGGPNGGDGGNGGSIYIEASRSFRTLIDLQYQQLYRAERGEHGRGKDQHGATGRDVTVLVPLARRCMPALITIDTAAPSAARTTVERASVNEGGWSYTG